LNDVIKESAGSVYQNDGSNNQLISSPWTNTSDFTSDIESGSYPHQPTMTSSSC